MELIKAGENGLSNEELEKISERLHGGAVVAIPTETVYGLAADAMNQEAVKKIFEIKGRPCDNPLIVHISNIKMLNNLILDFPNAAKKLINAFWPGPLTLVLKKNKKVPDVVTAGLDSVAVRMPEHKVALSIIEHANLPLAAPSANLSGFPSPTTARHCVDDLGSKVDLIIDGGSCKVGVESTIVLMTERPYKILRPGVITRHQIEEVIGRVETLQKYEGRIGDVCAPGIKYKHYSPNAEVVLIGGKLSEFVTQVSAVLDEHSCAMVFTGEKPNLNCMCFEYGKRFDSAELARNLFAVLRKVDELGFKRVFVRAPSPDYAVYDRLMRATGREIF
ncbi:threonylcarbamoyl-AMP synthase [Clostridia bacterium]|nr:threonylcarbamoyl-AMP synthase [Clostridia bacterium]